MAIILKSIGANKLDAIKVYMEVTGLDLSKSKKQIESVTASNPIVFFIDEKKCKEKEAVKNFSEIGAVAEITEDASLMPVSDESDVKTFCCYCRKKQSIDVSLFPTADDRRICLDCLNKMQTVTKKAWAFSFRSKEEKAYAKNNTSAFFMENLKNIEMPSNLLIINFQNKTLMCATIKEKNLLGGLNAYRFDQIIKYENGQNTYERQVGKKGHYFFRAIVGNYFAGPTGAVIGAMTRNDTRHFVSENGQYFIRVYFKEDDGAISTHYRTFGENRKRGTRESDKIEYVRYDSAFQKIIKMAENEENTTPPAATPIGNAVSTADEIKKFKELLDIGAITQDEYDAKKKQLLGL